MIPKKKKKKKKKKDQFQTPPLQFQRENIAFDFLWSTAGPASCKANIPFENWSMYKIHGDCLGKLNC